MMSDQEDAFGEFHKRREEWRARRQERREAWRAAWRARREERRSRWAHFGDPSFWGLDEASMRNAGMGGHGPGATSEVAALKTQVAEMEKTIAQLHQRIIVLEKLAVGSDDARLAAEIEKLRGKDE